MLIDFRTADDAGVDAWECGPALVHTVDFFTPIVDDPFTYGQIAAANALSDIYAMGYAPSRRWPSPGFRRSSMPRSPSAIFLGGYDKLAKTSRRCLVGTPCRDPEMKFGYAITGAVDPTAS